MTDKQPRPRTLGPQSISRHLRAAIVGSACILGCTAAAADDWQFNPRAEVGAEANDNYHLTAGDKVDAAGPFADAALEIKWLDPQTTLSVTPEVHETYLPDDHADDSTALFTGLDFDHKGQTYDAALTGNFTRELVVQSDQLTTAIGTGGLGNPTGGETSGYVSYRNTMELTQLTPTFTYDFTPRRRLILTGSYLNVDYSSTIAGAYVPFVDSGGSVGVAQDFTPRDTGTLTGTFANFNPHGESNTSNTYGLNGEWDHHVSAVQLAYIRVGAARTSYDYSAAVAGATPPSSTTWTAGAGTSWAFQVTQVFLDLTRTIDPNAIGYTVRRDQVRLLVTRNFTQKVVGTLGVRYYEDNPTNSTPLFSERKYVIGTVGLKWHWARAWTLSGEYDYTWQKFADQPDSAGSNSVLVGVTYEPIAQDVYHAPNPLP